MVEKKSKVALALPGDVVALPSSGGKIQASAKALCNQPLRSLELVVNGTVAARASLGADQHEAQVELRTGIERGSWIAARATAEDRLLSDEGLARYVKLEGKPQKPSRLLFGHTSPIYVTVGGVGAALPDSLQEASRMLDGFERFALRTAAEEYRGEVLEALRLARGSLNKKSK